MDKKHLNVNSLSYRHQEHVTDEEDSFRNSLFFGLFEDPNARTRSSGGMKRQYSDMGDNYHAIYRENSEEERGIDTRVLMLLEYFRELYTRESRILKEIFPGVKDDFLGFFKNIGEAVSRMKRSRERMEFRTIERSLSVGSPRRFASRGFDFGSGIPTGNERFKVSTVNSGGGIDVDGQTKK